MKYVFIYVLITASVLCFLLRRPVRPASSEQLLSYPIFNLSHNKPPNSPPSPHSLTWPDPPPLSRIYHVERGTIRGSRLANYSCFRPLVFLAYSRPVQQPVGHYELFAYTGGVHVGSFPREFNIRGCMLGKDVYPIDFTIMDVVRCTVPRTILYGEKVSIVLQKDDELEKAMSGPVELGPGVVVEFEDGDVQELPENTDMHLKDGTKREQLMSVRSEAQVDTIDEPVKERSEDVVRYEICATTQMRFVPHLLNDWVDYHRRVGVDMIYIMDNDSPEDLSKLFHKRKDVEVVYWPFQRSQIQAFTYFLQMSRSRCEWLLVLDADEYLMFGIGKNGEIADRRPLKRYVNRVRWKGDYNLLEFRFLIMGSSGIMETPKKPVPEVYLYRATKNDSRHGKTIVRCDEDWQKHGNHWAKCFTGKTKGYRTEKLNMYPVEDEEDPSIVHYRFRSFQEGLLKTRTDAANLVNNNRAGAKGNYSGVPEPPVDFFKKDKSMRYTHFRDIWRKVTEKGSIRKKRLVRVEGGKRCVLDCENEVCADVVCAMKPVYR